VSFEYRAFVDVAGGSGADSMTLAVAHAEPRGDASVAMLDLLREVRPPFSPEATVAEFAMVLRTYGVAEVVGDRYAGDWPREQFRRHGIEYVPSTRSKSDIYREVLPLINAGRVELLDHERLLQQLASLERRVARGGRDTVDHAPGSHDDVANAVCGALLLVAEGDGGEPFMLLGGSVAAEWEARRSPAVEATSEVAPADNEDEDDPELPDEELPQDGDDENGSRPGGQSWSVLTRVRQAAAGMVDAYQRSREERRRSHVTAAAAASRTHERERRVAALRERDAEQERISEERRRASATFVERAVRRNLGYFPDDWWR
jgi:hypothetical protein